MIDALLEEGLLKLGLEAADPFCSLLIRYVEEIELFNPAYGLVKVLDRRELIVKHILDSLAPVPIIRGLMQTSLHGKTVFRIADVGSGAGLPGIPLAVYINNAEFTLIERMGRRAGFLRNVIALLDLPNTRVEETEMEKISLHTPGCFDLIVFRAFRPLDAQILKGLLRLLAGGGTLAAYKGRRQTIEEEMTAAFSTTKKGKAPSIGAWEIIPLKVPFLEEERHLLLIGTSGI